MRADAATAEKSAEVPAEVPIEALGRVSPSSNDRDRPKAKVPRNNLGFWTFRDPEIRAGCQPAGQPPPFGATRGSSARSRAAACIERHFGSPFSSAMPRRMPTRPTVSAMHLGSGHRSLVLDDQSELRVGDAWDQSIREQIKVCTLFLPVISIKSPDVWLQSDPGSPLLRKHGPLSDALEMAEQTEV